MSSPFDNYPASQDISPEVSSITAREEHEDAALELISTQFLHVVREQRKKRIQAIYERKKAEKLKSVVIAYMRGADSPESPESQRRIIEEAMRGACETCARPS